MIRRWFWALCATVILAACDESKEPQVEETKLGNAAKPPIEGSPQGEMVLIKGGKFLMGSTEEDKLAQMVEKLLADRPMARGSRACVIINGMGGTTLMEQLTIWEETRRALASEGITAIAPMIGSYVTTQEMGGFSISFLEPTDDMLTLWCAPSDTPFFPPIQMRAS